MVPESSAKKAGKVVIGAQNEAQKEIKELTMVIVYDIRRMRKLRTNGIAGIARDDSCLGRRCCER